MEINKKAIRKLHLNMKTAFDQNLRIRKNFSHAVKCTVKFFLVICNLHYSIETVLHGSINFELYKLQLNSYCYFCQRETLVLISKIQFTNEEAIAVGWSEKLF